MNLIEAFLKKGWEVVAIAPEDAYSQRLVAAGCKFVPVKMENKGTNPVKDMLLVKDFYLIYKTVKPDVILQYTIKPNIYGTLAAKLAGIPTINNVSGLGTVFIVQNLVSKVALGLYKFAFQFPDKVFFHNEHDRQLFIEHHLIKPELTDIVPGSGINTNKFVPAATFVRNQPFVFLMIARVLYEKGIVEYVEAARHLKQKYPELKFNLLGGVDESGNIGVKRAILEGWIAEGIIEYLGTSDDVGAVIATADCVVLPSYREGTPKTLLEAAAMAKPIVTTNVAGCKETIIHNQSGYLCDVKSAEDLAAKMEQMYKLTDEELRKMGQAGRQLALDKFDEKHVIRKYIEAMEATVTHKK